MLASMAGAGVCQEGTREDGRQAAPRLARERAPCRPLGQARRRGRDGGFHLTPSPFASRKSTHETAAKSLNLGSATPPRPGSIYS